jgi:hypothetical protein
VQVCHDDLSNVPADVHEVLRPEDVRVGQHKVLPLQGLQDVVLGGRQEKRYEVLVEGLVLPLIVVRLEQVLVYDGEQCRLAVGFVHFLESNPCYHGLRVRVLLEHVLGYFSGNRGFGKSSM